MAERLAISEEISRTARSVAESAVAQVTSAHSAMQRNTVDLQASVTDKVTTLCVRMDTMTQDLERTKYAVLKAASGDLPALLMHAQSDQALTEVVSTASGISLSQHDSGSASIDGANARVVKLYVPGGKSAPEIATADVNVTQNSQQPIPGPVQPTTTLAGRRASVIGEKAAAIPSGIVSTELGGLVRDMVTSLVEVHKKTNTSQVS